MTSPEEHEEPRGLSDVPLSELRELRRALSEGRLTWPLSEFGLISTGLPRRLCGSIVRALGMLGQGAARAALELTMAERVHRPPPHLELVWTGPEAKGTSARDTSIVVRQLFESATRSVLIGGFRFDDCEVLFRTLHEKMKSGLHVSIFIDIDGHAASSANVETYAGSYVRRFLGENWPFGPPYPLVFYDPQSAIAGPPWVSLHAKCVIVDGATAFITSANFTNRGQTRNLEVGVLIEDRTFGEKLAGQWRALVARGLVQQAVHGLAAKLG